MKTITAIRESTGLNMTRFSEKYGIPYRTIQGWESGERKPPEYVVKLLGRAVAMDNGGAPALRALYDQTAFLYEKVIKNPINADKNLRPFQLDVLRLADAFFAIRGGDGTIVFIEGVDEIQNSMIYYRDSTIEDLYRSAMIEALKQSGINEPNSNDIERFRHDNFLTIDTARDGKDYAWARLPESEEAAICVDDLKELSKSDIKGNFDCNVGALLAIGGIR